jgi:Cu/Ag efflux pump CusA
MMGNQIKNSIQEIEGVVDVAVEQQTEVPQLQLRANRLMLAKYGITIDDFNRFINLAFPGEKLADIYEGERSFDLVIKLNDNYTTNIEQVKSALIDTGFGGKVPIEEVAEIVSVGGPNSISRENVQRKIVVSANVSSGYDLNGAVNMIRNRINSEITLPEGYRIEYGGQFENASKASRTLFITSTLAILVIFLLLFGEFKDLTLSGIILINLPLALIGGVFALLLTSGTVSIPSIIGFITLFGIATRNGILLVSRYEHMRQDGENLHDTVLKGSADRLNPILMTAITSALALIPLVFQGDKPGNEIQSPMAVVVLGGLITSTLLNIYIIPIVYEVIQKRRSRKINKLIVKKVK